MRAVSLKTTSGIGTALVCAAAGVLVVREPRPADAPLNPPASNTSTVTTSSTTLGSLVIQPSCNGSRGSSPSALTPAELDVVRQLKAAKTAAERRAILRSLPADERQQVTAYLNTRTRATGCAAGSTSSEQVAPSIVGDAGDMPVITDSHVS